MTRRWFWPPTWADNLPEGAGKEIDTFLGYHRAVPNLPVEVAATGGDL